MIEPLLEAERALTMGLLDQAERMYRAVADADPRNSIAVVGLARVAIERGDDLAALRLGRDALAIDPENVAALRLVVRLEEVLETRGVEVPPDVERPRDAGRPPAPPVASTSPSPLTSPTSAPSSEPSPGSVPLGRPAVPAGRRRGVIGRLLRRGR